MTYFIASPPAHTREASPIEVRNEPVAEPMETNMSESRPDPNAELHTREPLRIVFALAALLLGAIVALH